MMDAIERRIRFGGGPLYPGAFQPAGPGMRESPTVRASARGRTAGFIGLQRNALWRAHRQSLVATAPRVAQTVAFIDCVCRIVL